MDVSSGIESVGSPSEKKFGSGKGSECWETGSGSWEMASGKVSGSWEMGSGKCKWEVKWEVEVGCGSGKWIADVGMYQ
jgi:hypothetical protein